MDQRGQDALNWTRLSCYRFVANQVRLWLFVPAYDLVGLIWWLTASVSDTTMALSEHGALLGSRQLDMGKPGLEGVRFRSELFKVPQKQIRSSDQRPISPINVLG